MPALSGESTTPTAQVGGRRGPIWSIRVVHKSITGSRGKKCEAAALLEDVVESWGRGSPRVEGASVRAGVWCDKKSGDTEFGGAGVGEWAPYRVVVGGPVEVAIREVFGVKCGEAAGLWSCLWVMQRGYDSTSLRIGLSSACIESGSVSDLANSFEDADDDRTVTIVGHACRVDELVPQTAKLDPEHRQDVLDGYIGRGLF
ncbi:hypothetical protein EDB92DRAFT_1813701 [Lactarius akahatsu]|uniref:Uncharacterized protein n=1 Tax=Lactarius akahatsu TaxID=416441 RepID=A0AAD4LST3_9AGAM|nr:hypothetical protein EDB92DRAFT_1813701 [Lactarius akahatsu]